MQKELELDEKALLNLQKDRQRFLCKAVENYIQCLEQGEEHNTWVFRLASLWLKNADIKVVNDTMKVSAICVKSVCFELVRVVKQKVSCVRLVSQRRVKQIPSYKFLPLMYQLAARMGTKMTTSVSEDTGFYDVLNDVICFFLLFINSS